jgi:hypothetical protein
MGKYAVWVHGNVAVAEQVGGALVTSPGPLTNVDGVAWTDVVGLPQGMRKRFRGKANTSNWFHFPLPTPVVVPTPDVPTGNRASLERVFVLFRLEEREGRLTDVHVWDGPRPIAQARWGGLDRAGDFSQGINWDPMRGNVFTVPEGQRPAISFGLGVSVRISFGDRDGDVVFTAVGADFIV